MNLCTLLKLYYLSEIYVAEIFYLCFLKLEAMEGEVKSGGNTQWTATQSYFVQTFFAKHVTEGTKTSTGFKKVHLNSCAKAVNEHFKINGTGDLISNHLKTLKKVH
jgi:hypothetical protein